MARAGRSDLGPSEPASQQSLTVTASMRGWAINPSELTASMARSEAVAFGAAVQEASLLEKALPCFKNASSQLSLSMSVSMSMCMCRFHVVVHFFCCMQVMTVTRIEDVAGQLKIYSLTFPNTI